MSVQLEDIAKIICSTLDSFKIKCPLIGLGRLTCSSPSHQPVEFFAKTTISCPGDKVSWCTVGVPVLVLVTAWAISVDQTQTVE